MKTASTYLQHCFVSVMPQLQELGVYYAPELIDPGNKHMHMPVYKGVVRDKGKSLRSVFAEINRGGHETVVLSCEHLIFLRRDELALLCDVIGVPEIDIVYVIRRWSDRIGSLWTQTLYMGESQTLPEFYLKLLDAQAPDEILKRGRRPAAYDLNYSLAWNDIISIVGRDALKLFSSSNVTDDKDDLFVRFCSDILGLRESPTPELLGEKRWASMSRDDAEILRTLNGMYVKKHDKTTTHFRKLMLSRRFKMEDALIRNAIAADMTELNLDDRAAHFDTTYQALTAYTDLIVPGGSAGPRTIFTRSSRQQDYARQGWLTEPGVAEAIRALYSRMMALPSRAKAPSDD